MTDEVARRASFRAFDGSDPDIRMTARPRASMSLANRGGTRVSQDPGSISATTKVRIPPSRLSRIATDAPRTNRWAPSR